MSSKYLIFQPQALASTSQSTPAQVKIKVVDKVSQYDFPQAQRAWEALLEAGIEPGELIAKGLNIGHGYQIKEYSTSQTLQNLPSDLVSESKFSDSTLMGYCVSVEESEAISLLGSSQTQSLIPLNQLITQNPSSQKSINFTAVLKTQPKVIDSEEFAR